MVAGFSSSAPNGDLIEYAAAELARCPGGRIVDLGCGAGRNAIPLAELGWRVLGLDLSQPMLEAAARRVREQRLEPRVQLALAPMDRLPVRDRSADLLVAHGIWNLARSGAEFRRAVEEAARVAAEGAGLFVFTFSRHTFPPAAEPVPGESFVFTQFSGEPQCFLTQEQLVSELAAAGFVVDERLPIREFNRPKPGEVRTGGPPVIYQAAFRYLASRRDR